MSEEDTITLTIKKSNHKTLAQLKIDEDLKTFDEALEFIFDNQKIRVKNE